MLSDALLRIAAAATLPFPIRRIGQRVLIFASTATRPGADERFQTASRNASAASAALRLVQHREIGRQRGVPPVKSDWRWQQLENVAPSERWAPRIPR
jgi:hypothetical protein